MLQLRVFPQQGFILAGLSGLVSVDAWSNGLQQLEAALAGEQADRLVLDLTGLVGWLGEHERTQVGAMMAQHLARMKKVAAFIQPEKIAGVVEAQARKGGLDLRLFAGKDEAVGWVLSE